MIGSKQVLKDFLLQRGTTNSPVTYKELGQTLGFHWRDRTLNAALGEISQETWDDLGILISAMVGHAPTTVHGSITPGEGFPEITQRIAGIHITDIEHYRRHIQKVLQSH